MKSQIRRVEPTVALMANCGPDGQLWPGVPDSLSLHYLLGERSPINGLALPSLKLTAKAPENKPSQKESSIPTINFEGLC